MTPPCVSPCFGPSTPWIPLSGPLRLGTIALDCLLSTRSGQSAGGHQRPDSGVKLTAETGLRHRYRDMPGLRPGGAVRIITCIEDSIAIQKIPDLLKTKPAEPFRYPKAGRRQEHCSAGATVFVQPRMQFPGSPRQGTAARSPGMVWAWHWRGRLFQWVLTEWTGTSGGQGPLVRASGQCTHFGVSQWSALAARSEGITRR